MTRRSPSFPLAIAEGAFRISADLDDSLRQAAGAAARRGAEAFPGLAFVLALGGAGEPISDTLARAGFSIAQSPLLAACDIRLAEPLRIETDYLIAGQVVDTMRKSSRRFGAADHLRLRYDFARGGHGPVGSLELTMVIGAENE